MAAHCSSLKCLLFAFALATFAVNLLIFGLVVTKQQQTQLKFQQRQRRQQQQQQPTGNEQLSKSSAADNSSLQQKQQQRKQQKSLLVVNKKRQSDDKSNDTQSQQTKRHKRQRRRLNVGVKSSKSHVLVTANGIVIYESKSPAWHTKQSLAKRSALSSQTKPPSIVSQRNATTKTFAIQTATATATTKHDEQYSNKRGIHVLVLSQFDGSLLSARVFDTYLPQQDDELTLFVRLVTSNRILVFAVQDEASFQMARSSLARKTLTALGSSQIKKLAWRNMWAFVARKVPLLTANASKPQVFAEQLTQQHQQPAFNGGGWAPAAQVNASIELVGDGSQIFECAFESGNDVEDARRLEFCSRVDAYGAVCDCNSPAPLNFKPKQLNLSELVNVPIVVMASNRPHYLYRMLRSLLSADGMTNKSQIVVFVDGYYEEPAMVARLFELRVINLKPQGVRNARISHHYKQSLTTTFSIFPQATHAIILEDDLDVASDFLVYFNAMLPVLRVDPTLYCVSAWNDQGYEHTIGNSQLVYRVESMPGLGWLLSRELYKRELEPHWPSPDIAHDWDMWIRTNKVRRDRECLVPDVSRTFHFGASGTNINAYFQRKYFSKHAIYNAEEKAYHSIEFNSIDDKHKTTAFNKYAYLDTEIETKNAAHNLFENVHNLTAQAYEQMIVSIIKNAQVVNSIINTTTTTMKSTTSSATDIKDFTNEHNLITTTTNHTNAFQNQIADKDYICNFASVDNFAKLSLVPNSNKDKLSSQQKRAYVIFIDMIDKNDFGTWLKLAKCWNIWDLDARGQHNSMWRLFAAKRQTLVIGVPASPYSTLMPSNIRPFKF